MAGALSQAPAIRVSVFRYGSGIVLRNRRGATTEEMSVTPDARKGRRARPYTTAEAATELEVSQRTVIRWCNAGLIDHFWTPGHGQRRIHVSALEKFRKARG
jgi:excisionase family DNA binding protein